MTLAIQVEHLSKRYSLGAREAFVQRTLGDSISQVARNPLVLLRRLRKRGRSQEKTHWALHDLNFTIHAGEVVGIVGDNGSGKSTLLKILSRIVEPTQGRATVNGRLGSLLEVGAGFHPELTGRENIFLNGSFLGMSRREVIERFDEIVAFSEVDRFLEIPVKRYSSGMYVRLAFAVAAHSNPEILIIDEVLAVGDASFQEKCMQRVKSLLAQERTVLIVSHQAQTLRSLANRVLLLKSGRLVADGPTDEVLDQYYHGQPDGSSPSMSSNGFSDSSHSSREKLAWVRRHLVERLPLDIVCRQAGVSASEFTQWQDALFEHGAIAFDQLSHSSSSANS